MNVIGVSTYKMDSRNRIFIPVRLRPVTGTEMYLLLAGKPARIQCMTKEDIQGKIDEIKKMYADKPYKREKELTKLYAHTDLQTVDAQGRVCLKQEFLETIGIKDNIVAVMGTDEYFEIWNNDTLTAFTRFDDDDENELDEFEVQELEERAALIERKRKAERIIKGIE